MLLVWNIVADIIVQTLQWKEALRKPKSCIMYHIYTLLEVRAKVRFQLEVRAKVGFHHRKGHILMSNLGVFFIAVVCKCWSIVIIRVIF